MSVRVHLVLHICFHIYYCYYCSVFVVFFCFIFPHAPITALKSKRARTTSQTENISPTDRPIDRPIYIVRERDDLHIAHSRLNATCEMYMLKFRFVHRSIQMLYSSNSNPPTQSTAAHTTTNNTHDLN